MDLTQVVKLSLLRAYYQRLLLSISKSHWSGVLAIFWNDDIGRVDTERDRNIFMGDNQISSST